MFKSLHPNRVFLFSLISFVGLGIAFYFILGRNADLTITQQLLQKQQSITKAEANNITGFFDVIGGSVTAFTKRSAIDEGEASISKDIDVFVEQWSKNDLVRGIIYVDKDGIVKSNSNILGTHDVGASLVDRDYFVWAKEVSTNEKYFIGQPVISKLGASKGEVIVPVASAIYRNGGFKGVLVASIKLGSLTQYYLELIRISDDTDVYLLDESGEVLYNNSLGKSSSVGRDGLLSSVRSALSSKKEGRIEASEHLITYSPVVLNNKTWTLIMATPSEDVNAYTVPIFIRIAAVLFLVYITLFGYGYLLTNEAKRVEM